ncbi:MAG: type II toxin-antitoxin system prevent-host-death family antitoxin [Bacteroidota bacterium]
MNVGELKANFSQVLDKVKKGEEIIITYGKRKKKWPSLFQLKNTNQKKSNLVFLKGKLLLRSLMISRWLMSSF